MARRDSWLPRSPPPCSPGAAAAEQPPTPTPASTVSRQHSVSSSITSSSASVTPSSGAETTSSRHRLTGDHHRAGGDRGPSAEPAVEPTGCSAGPGRGSCSAAAPAASGGFSGVGSAIDDALAARMSASWRPGCPVELADLRYVSVTYHGFDGADHQGELVVAASVADAVVAVFDQLYDNGYPIASMRLVDDFGASDDASMAADNTSAFNCRPVTGGGGWSEHSYGTAIDLNPSRKPVRQRRYGPAAGRRGTTPSRPNCARRDPVRRRHCGGVRVDRLELGWLLDQPDRLPALLAERPLTGRGRRRADAGLSVPAISVFDVADKQLTRIAALLRKAESTDNPHEADAFLQAAQRLATLASVDLAVARAHTRGGERRATPGAAHRPDRRGGQARAAHLRAAVPGDRPRQRPDLRRRAQLDAGVRLRVRAGHRRGRGAVRIAGGADGAVRPTRSSPPAATPPTSCTGVPELDLRTSVAGAGATWESRPVHPTTARITFHQAFAAVSASGCTPPGRPPVPKRWRPTRFPQGSPAVSRSCFATVSSNWPTTTASQQPGPRHLGRDTGRRCLLGDQRGGGRPGRPPGATGRRVRRSVAARPPCPDDR